MATDEAAANEPIWKPLGATDAIFLDNSLLANRLIQKATDRLGNLFNLTRENGGVVRWVTR